MKEPDIIWLKKQHNSLYSYYKWFENILKLY
jgi:hypothetical protein